MSRMLTAMGAGALLWFLINGVAFAHNCTDPGDCLQTAGFNGALGAAGGIAGVIATVTVLVNGLPSGPALAIRPPAGQGASDGEAEGEEEEEPRHYSLDIRTQDQRSDLAADGEDTLWIYAFVTCDDPDVDTASLTAGLGFAAEGANAAWLRLDAPRMVEGSKAVRVSAWPPAADQELHPGETSVRVSVTIEGTAVSGAVPLMLEAYILEVTAIN